MPDISSIMLAINGMKRKRLSKSIKKFIRKEKARIRRSVFDTGKQQELINGLRPVKKPISQKEDKKSKVSSKKNESF